MPPWFDIYCKLFLLSYNVYLDILLVLLKFFMLPNIIPLLSESTSVMVCLPLSLVIDLPRCTIYPELLNYLPPWLSNIVHFFNIDVFSFYILHLIIYENWLSDKRRLNKNKFRSTCKWFSNWIKVICYRDVMETRTAWEHRRLVYQIHT